MNSLTKTSIPYVLILMATVLQLGALAINPPVQTPTMHLLGNLTGRAPNLRGQKQRTNKVLAKRHGKRSENLLTSKNKREQDNVH